MLHTDLLTVDFSVDCCLSVFTSGELPDKWFPLETGDLFCGGENGPFWVGNEFWLGVFLLNDAAIISCAALPIPSVLSDPFPEVADIFRSWFVRAGLLFWLMKSEQIANKIFQSLLIIFETKSPRQIWKEWTFLSSNFHNVKQFSHMASNYIFGCFRLYAISARIHKLRFSSIYPLL